MTPLSSKLLVALLLLVVKGQLVHQAAAATALDTDADEAAFRASFLGHQATDLVSGILVNGDHAVYVTGKIPLSGDGVQR